MEDWRGDLLKIGITPDDMPDQTNFVLFNLDELNDFIKDVVEKAREEGRMGVYEAIVFDKNIPHDITTFVAANLWKNMRDKAKEELSKLKTKEDEK